MKHTRLLAALALLGAASASAQVIYSTAGATHSQNFNWTTTGSGTSQTVAWTNNAATQPFTTVNFSGSSLGWYAGSNAQDSTNIRAGNGNDGTNAGGQINNYYFASDNTDRSFGGRPTGTVPMVLALRINNNTGATLNSFTLGYRLEVTQWRANGTQATANVSYFTGAPTNWRTDAFTAAPTLNLSTVYSGAVGTAVSNVDGNAAGNFNTLAATTISGLSIAAGQDLWIRWTVPAGTNLPNVGLDDVSFSAASAVPEPSAFAALAGLAVLGLAATRRRRA